MGCTCHEKPERDDDGATYVGKNLLVSLLLIVFCAQSGSEADWPQWLGPNRNGIATEETDGSLLETPQMRWRANVGVGVSSVVVSQGRAFTIGHTRGPRNRGKDTVYCFDADTGDIIWKYSYDCLSCETQDVRFYGPRSTPTVDGDVVYALSLEGHLFCFEAGSGKVLWSKELPQDYNGRIPLYGYCCSPLVYGNALILELNAEAASYVALDKSNGAVVWRCSGGQVTCGSPVLTNIGGVDCAVFMGGGAVVGVSAATGAELWRHRTWGHAWMGPVVSGNRVFVANASLPRGCGVIRIDNGKPAVPWEAKKKFQTLHCNAVIWQGHIYGFDNTGTDYQGKDSKKSSLKCLDLDTGEVRWVQQKMGWGNLIVVDGNLVILREAGELIVAKASDQGYEELIRHAVLDGQSWTVPAFAESKVYCRNNSGEVVCLQLFGSASEAVRRTRTAKEVARPPSTLSRDKFETRKSKPAISAQGVPGQWPRFRGPGGLGITPYSDIPTSGDAIIWKVPVPLTGQSSPVVWDKYVFLTGANNERREVYCFDADRGTLVWRREVVPSAMGTARMPKDDIVLAAPTPVTDGRYIYAVFGTGDVACLDFQGKPIWAHDLGMLDNEYGHSASLEMCEGPRFVGTQNLLLVQLDQSQAEDRKSKLIALDALSGQMVWQTPRPVPCSWSSPIVIDAGGQKQIITSADPWVIAYEPATGDEIWRAKCLGGQVVPSPIYANGLVYAVSPDGSLAAIRTDGKGDVTETHIVWSADEGLPSICSPACNGELIWLLDSGGLLTCYDAMYGKKIWQMELDSSFQASPTVINDSLCLLGDDGTLFILKADRRCALLGRIELREPCQASPAFGAGRMYIRTKGHLYCFGSSARLLR